MLSQEQIQQLYDIIEDSPFAVEYKACDWYLKPWRLTIDDLETIINLVGRDKHFVTESIQSIAEKDEVLGMKAYEILRDIDRGILRDHELVSETEEQEQMHSLEKDISSS